MSLAATFISSAYTFRLLIRDAGQVAEKDVVAVQAQLGGDVVVRRLAHRAGLRMIRRPPGSRGAGVRHDRGPLAAAIRRIEDVRDHALIDPARRRTVGSPVVRIPDLDHAVLVGADADLDDSPLGRQPAVFNSTSRSSINLTGRPISLANLRRHDAPGVRLRTCCRIRRR